MVTTTEVVVGLVIVLGVAGVVIPVLPGSLLVFGAVLVWAAELGERTGWMVFAVATVVLLAGAVVKYAVPGKQLRRTVPTSTLVVGGLGALVGFFVVPVVGALAGFPLGVYAAERRRIGPEGAWPSTKAALRAVGLSILIELAAAVLAAGTWVVGAAVT